MRSSKSRSRSKSNRPRTLGNIINRVFDSSGPEGKVRGTPQQIIEKYLFLARDAQLSNDRVAAENFLQHAEHYTRLLGEAQREMAAEQEARQQYGQQNQNGQNQRNGERDSRGDYRDSRPINGDEDQPDLAPHGGFGLIGDDEPSLVDLPEAPRQESRNDPRSDGRREPRPDQRPRDDYRRDDRPRDERPRNERPREDRPREERPREERVRDERPRDDQPRAEVAARVESAPVEKPAASRAPRSSAPRAPRKPKDTVETGPVDASE